MTKTIINPPSLAKPSGFSHAIVAEGRTVFLAGQPGLNANGIVVSPGDLVAQFEQALANIRTIIETAGGTMQDIVKLTFYVMDKDDYKAQLKPIGKVYRSYFEGYYPATTLVEVSGLFDEGALIELDCFAVLK
jgi:enamine deaminase RidA (YjgF/YER057c/UK114 family)